MTAIPPVIRSITVPWARDAAFRRFTQDIATWWPLSSHSIGQDAAMTVTFEGRVGGRIYETISGGTESDWGKVTAWDPPHRVAFTWHPGQQADTAQLVEVQFAAEGAGTRVQLTHSGWEKLGARQGQRMRRAYGMGWAGVLRMYQGRGWGPYIVLIGVARVITFFKKLLGDSSRTSPTLTRQAAPTEVHRHTK
jgi:uncharacterized protein YndB with AHSA1/START domain